MPEMKPTIDNTTNWGMAKRPHYDGFVVREINGSAVIAKCRHFYEAHQHPDERGIEEGFRVISELACSLESLFHLEQQIKELRTRLKADGRNQPVMAPSLGSLAIHH